MKYVTRRQFLQFTASAAALIGTNPNAVFGQTDLQSTPPFQISLAEWSLHRSIFGKGLIYGKWQQFGAALQKDPDSVLQGELDHLEFAATARSLGINAVEYVNTFFYGRARDTRYIKEMAIRADNEGIKSLLIMCDALGSIGDPDEIQRTKVVENHVPWIQAASMLGCHSIRVNARSNGSWIEQQKLAADGLHKLCREADGYDINILVENHGGLSSNGKWLSETISRVDHPRIGTLPDFGNFKVDASTRYDNYKGVEELMPQARGVSAKSYAFDKDGNETTLDYERLLDIVLDSGYRGYVGIEYEGSQLGETEGIVATRTLLERIRAQYLISKSA